MPGMVLAAGEYFVEQRLVLVLVQLCTIMFVARAVGILFRRLGQPTVVGEILAGLTLGPSILGKMEFALWQGHPISNTLFNSQAGDVLTVLKELGLILTLFLIGLEFDFSHLKSRSKSAVTISLAGLVIPFVLGCLLAAGVFDMIPRDFAEADSRRFSRLGFTLFMGTAMSITALPVLGRMMQEWNITRTRLGVLVITAAAIDDAIGWILLAGVSAAARLEYTIGSTLLMVGMVAGFAAVMIFVVRHWLVRWARWVLDRGGGEVGPTGLATLLIMVCLVGVITSWIGIFAIFGAFLLGAILSGERRFAEAVSRQLNGFVVVFFLPIFFTYTGLRTNIDALDSGLLWGVAAAICGAAVLGKVGACTLAARVSGLGMRESTLIGVMMNTRGLMELVVINVGRDLGVIPASVYCMLVMMAVVTTTMTTPLVSVLKGGTELENLMKRSGMGGVTR